MLFNLLGLNKKDRGIVPCHFLYGQEDAYAASPPEQDPPSAGASGAAAGASPPSAGASGAGAAGAAGIAWSSAAGAAFMFWSSIDQNNK